MHLNPKASAFVPNKYTKARMNIKKEIFAKMNTIKKSVQIVRKLNVLLKLPTNKEFSNAIGMKMNNIVNISKSEKRKLKARKNKHLKRIQEMSKKIRGLIEEHKKLNIIRKLPSRKEFFNALTSAPLKSRCGA